MSETATPEPVSHKVQTDREILQEAHAEGAGATLKAWIRLSGPGWIQSAITLGGGSLAGALFMGILGGTSLLWLQLMAIIMGVVMLSAISYVTLSTGQRPFQQINDHINPVLGWGWVIATVAANMIFLMPQFALCYAALNTNLAPGIVGTDTTSKFVVSALLLAAAGGLVYLNAQKGLGAMIFDWILKAMIGTIVICFFGVVIVLGWEGTAFQWSEVFAGFVPDLNAWFKPTGHLDELIAQVPEEHREYWTSRLVEKQRAAMIGAAATAVGINMTFMLPYSMLARGWDKPFRGLARFDLSTGMAIPYVLVTSCVVIASAAAFHAQVDEDFLSNSPETMAKSPVYAGAKALLEGRVQADISQEGTTPVELSEDELAQRVADLPAPDKQLAASLVQRNEFLLSRTLAPLLGEDTARLVFGIGIFGMGFSTIIILIMINGYAFTEMTNSQPYRAAYVVGCLVAGLSGASWFVIWDGPAKTWLAILVSSFAIMFLPIAYFTFFMMMNSKRILGDAKPTGVSWLIWNVLMIIAVLGAIAAAVASISDKVANPNTPDVQKIVVLVVVIGYLLLATGGFFFCKKHQPTTEENAA